MPDHEDQPALKMGALTKIAGVSDQAIRHYERLGLLRPNGRTQGGFRLFHPTIVERLRSIRAGQALGLSLESIKVILATKAQFDAPCRTAQALMASHLTALDQQIELLQARKVQLIALSETCTQCAGACHLEPALTSLAAPEVKS